MESDRTVTEQAIAMEQQDGPWSSAMPISDNQKEETSETDDEQEALVSIDIDLVQTSKTWKLRAHQTNSTHICETLQQPPK
ncbi:MAG: hypothetical protein R3A11_05990 [Bdellovibrionota bacterium]